MVGDKAPRAAKTPPTPLPQRGAKPGLRTFARERSSSPPSPLGGRVLPRRVESLATVLGPRTVTALQPSCEGTTQMTVPPIRLGSLWVVNVAE